MKNPVTIKMDAQDFERLSSTIMEWGNDWTQQVKDGRFESVDVCFLAADMKWIYWYSSPVEYILAKSYLQSNRISFFTTEDLWSGDSVILTDYMVSEVSHAC